MTFFPHVLAIISGQTLCTVLNTILYFKTPHTTAVLNAKTLNAKDKSKGVV